MLKINCKSKFFNVKQFVEIYGPDAMTIQAKTGISALALMGQVALETGYGAKILKVFDDKGHIIISKNLFNIKADNTWTGEKGFKNVYEFDIDGRKFISKEWFKIYNSYYDAFIDYLHIISTHSRYEKAWPVRHDTENFIYAIAAAGWATDPQYAPKILSIIKNNFEIVEA